MCVDEFDCCGNGYGWVVVVFYVIDCEFYGYGM